MNLKLNIVLILTYLSVGIFTACKPHEQKTDDAFEQVKEEKELTNDSDIINDAMMLQKTKLKSVPAAKKIIRDEQTLFRIETVKKIQNNEKQIKVIKAFPDANAGLNKKITSLEKENNNLTITMDEYKKDEKLRWELFKATMNQHVDEIGIQLKAIKINNKK